MEPTHRVTFATCHYHKILEKKIYHKENTLHVSLSHDTLSWLSICMTRGTPLTLFIPFHVLSTLSGSLLFIPSLTFSPLFTNLATAPSALISDQLCRSPLFGF